MALVERTGTSNPFDTIDVGNNSKPVFADIDNDGDRDLIVASEENGFSYYRNAGNQQYTQLTGLGTNPIDRIDSTNRSSSIAFADLDQDSDLDAVVGSNLGTLEYFRNAGMNNNVMQWTRTEADSPFRLYNPTVAGQNLGFSHPAFADWDKDGDLDAFVGSAIAGVIYLQNNNGTFEQVTNTLNPFQQWNQQNVDNYNVTTPTLVDIDRDGDLDAFVGSVNGYIDYLRNDNGVLLSQPYANNPFQEWNDAANQNANQNYSSPIFIDVDNDGDLDAVVGNTNGTLRYFENTGNVPGNKPTEGDDLITGTPNTDNPENVPGNKPTEGDDLIIGTPNADTLFGAGGNDTLWGAGGDDTLDGGSGNDILLGNAGQDVLNGNVGNDRLVGDGGRDRLLGGDGNDVLAGGADQDILNGGFGKDYLDGGLGKDVIITGRGRDRIVLRAGQGFDRVRDFVNGTDLIDLVGVRFGQLTIRQLNNNVLISLGSERLMLLESIRLRQINRADFV